MDKKIEDENYLLSLKEDDLLAIRKKEPLKYKQICKNYTKIYEPKNLQDFALSIIKRPSQERQEDEISILMQWTSQFQFFKELNQKPRNVQTKLHDKCCAKMQYETAKAGSTVFMAGDLPQKFYIVLKGTVNVLIPKSPEVLQKEIDSEKAAYLQMNQNDRKNTIYQQVIQLKDRIKKIQFIKDVIAKHEKLNEIAQQQELERQQQLELQMQQQMQQQSENKRSSKQYLQRLSKIQEEDTIQEQEKPESIDKQQLLNRQLSKKNVQSDSENNCQQPQLQQTPLSLKNSPSMQPMPTLTQQFSQLELQTQVSKFNQFSPSDTSSSNLQHSGSKQLNRQLSRQQSNVLSSLPQLTSTQSTYSGEIFFSFQSSMYSGQTFDQNETDVPYKKLLLMENKLIPYSDNVDTNVLLSMGLTPDQIMISLEDIKFLKSELNKIQQQFTIQDELNSISDPVFKGMGGIMLSAIDDIQKYIQEGVLKHKYIISLGCGKMFGEMGLLLKKPRAATITVKEDTVFAVLGANDYRNILEVAEKKKFNDKVDFFSANLLQKCGRQIVAKMSINFEKRQYNRGSIIYCEGEPAKQIYLIKKGSVELFKLVKEELSYAEQINRCDTQNKMIQVILQQEYDIDLKQNKIMTVPISVLTKGQSFGQIEIINSIPRQTFAICISEKATIYSLSQQVNQY